MKAVVTASGSQTFGPYFVSDPGNQWQNHSWHYFASGTWGSGGSFTLQYSPDDKSVYTANPSNVRWFTPATIGTINSAGDGFFYAKARMFRLEFSGGDGTTNCVLEIV